MHPQFTCEPWLVAYLLLKCPQPERERWGHGRTKGQRKTERIVRSPKGTWYSIGWAVHLKRCWEERQWKYTGAGQMGLWMQWELRQSSGQRERERAVSFHLLSWTAAMDLSLHLKFDLLGLAMPERRSLFLSFLSLGPSFYLSLFFFWASLRKSWWARDMQGFLMNLKSQWASINDGLEAAFEIRSTWQWDCRKEGYSLHTEWISSRGRNKMPSSVADGTVISCHNSWRIETVAFFSQPNTHL